MTMTNTILNVENVSKLYARSHHAARLRLKSTLGAAFLGRAPKITQQRAKEIWAVHNVSFSLERGEAIGIIGLNGSGKTTLLRMIAGQLLPDVGKISVSGQSASVIALTAGIQNNLSGLQNIDIRSAMLGRSREETDAIRDDIIEFSELGEAINAPILTYSAGMRLRLAFAITIFMKPDLLVVDETLQVGDFQFRQKCQEAVKNLRSKTSFVLVSHSMNDISRFCDKAIVLEKGEVAFSGDSKPAIEFYNNIGSKGRPKKKTRPDIIPEKIHRTDIIENVEFSWIGSDGIQKTSFYDNEPVRFRCRFLLKKEVRKFVIGMPVYAQGQELRTGFSTEHASIEINPPVGKLVEVNFSAPSPVLNPGTYRAAIGIVDGLEHIFMDVLPDIEIKSTGRLTWGTVSVPHDWSIREL
jgi:homopolymeric O-antigen transport system ATP-binding protein